MDTILFALQLLLAGIFGVAAVTKIIDRAGSRKAMTQFGVPHSVAPALSFVLPVTEMSVAIALLVPWFVWWGALGALTLLSLFTVVIAVNLGLGRKTDCHCLGQLHSKPIGWTTLARNLGLAAVTLIILTQAGEIAGPLFPMSLVTLVTARYFAVVFYVVTVLVLALQSWLILHLIRQNGRLFLRMDSLELRLDASGIPHVGDHVAAGLPIGSEAPSFDLPLLSGERLSLDGLLKHGKALLLIFSDPNCNPCNALLTDIASWELSEKLVSVVISRGSQEDNQAKAASYGLRYVVIQKDNEVAERYLTNATPSAVVVGDDGTIRTNLAIGAEAIIELATSLGGLNRPTHLPLAPPNGHHQGTEGGLEIGTQAPALALRGLDGGDVELAHFRGRKTLLLFWNPDCRFCDQMLPELKVWESATADSHSAFLIVSSGTIDANRAMGLRSTVALDQTFRAGRAFGVSGTPSAILIDEDGIVASKKAVGAPAIRVLVPSLAIARTDYLPPDRANEIAKQAGMKI